MNSSASKEYSGMVTANENHWITIGKKGKKMIIPAKTSLMRKDISMQPLSFSNSIEWEKDSVQYDIDFPPLKSSPRLMHQKADVASSGFSYDFPAPAKTSLMRKDIPMQPLSFPNSIEWEKDSVQYDIDFPPLKSSPRLMHQKADVASSGPLSYDFPTPRGFFKPQDQVSLRIVSSTQVDEFKGWWESCGKDSPFIFGGLQDYAVEAYKLTTSLKPNDCPSEVYFSPLPNYDIGMKLHGGGDDLDFVLDRIDIASLNKEQWLTAPIINCILRDHCQKYPNDGAFIVAIPTVQTLFDYDSDEHIQDMIERYFPKDLVGKIIMPCLSTGHYWLVHCDIEDGHATLSSYCSLGKYYNDKFHI